LRFNAIAEFASNICGSQQGRPRRGFPARVPIHRSTERAINHPQRLRLRLQGQFGIL